MRAAGQRLTDGRCRAAAGARRLMSTNNGGASWGCVQNPQYGHGSTNGLGSLVGFSTYTNPAWPSTCVGTAPYAVQGVAYDNSTRLWFHGIDTANWLVGSAA